LGALTEDQEIQLFDAIEGTRFPNGWVAHIEHGDAILIENRDRTFDIAATPEWEGQNVIGLQILNEDGRHKDLGDLRVNWTGDSRKDAQLWKKALLREWKNIAKAVERAFGLTDVM